MVRLPGLLRRADVLYRRRHVSPTARRRCARRGGHGCRVLPRVPVRARRQAAPMDVVSGLIHGFGVALQPMNLLWCFVGVVLGTVVGVMPGLGPPATIAMLLPLTVLIDPASPVIMLAGIHDGVTYGSDVTSIPANAPGEAPVALPCLDGYQMARQGRAGAALGMAAMASFIAGTVGVVGIMLIAPPLAKVALAFSSPEYFALMSLGLAMVVLLAGRSMV